MYNEAQRRSFFSPPHGKYPTVESPRLRFRKQEIVPPDINYSVVQFAQGFEKWVMKEVARGSIPAYLAPTIIIGGLTFLGLSTVACGSSGAASIDGVNHNIGHNIGPTFDQTHTLTPIIDAPTVTNTPELAAPNKILATKTPAITESAGDRHTNPKSTSTAVFIREPTVSKEVDSNYIVYFGTSTIKNMSDEKDNTNEELIKMDNQARVDFFGYRGHTIADLTRDVANLEFNPIPAYMAVLAPNNTLWMGIHRPKELDPNYKPDKDFITMTVKSALEDTYNLYSRLGDKFKSTKFYQIPALPVLTEDDDLNLAARLYNKGFVEDILPRLVKEGRRVSALDADMIWVKLTGPDGKPDRKFFSDDRHLNAKGREPIEEAVIMARKK